MIHHGLLELTSIYSIFEPVAFVGLILLIMRAFYLGWLAHELIDHDRFIEGDIVTSRGFYWSIALALVSLNIWWLADHFVLLNAAKWIGLIGSIACLLLVYRAHDLLKQLGFKRK